MGWRRARDIVLLLGGAVALMVSLVVDSGGYLWLIFAGTILGSVGRLLGWSYPVDPSKSGIQHWRERRHR